MLLLAAALAYALGCLSTGYYLVRLRTGADVRGHGSGSTGARNAGRVLGRSGFALVLLGDAAKGAAALGLAAALGTGRPGMVVAMIAATLGHLFPAQLGFRGGKGAATALGALLVLAPATALGGLLLCAVLRLLLRHTMTAALLVYALLPALAGATGHPWWEVAGVAALGALLLHAHRDHLPAALQVLRLPAPSTDPSR